MSTQFLKFPDNFVWGTATAAYQIEGGASEGGKGPSVWDEFAAKPGAIEDGTTGETACDHYHRFREDFRLMKELGLKDYRLSFSWPRIIPQGKGAVNQAGLDFYDRLIDELGACGITPWVTLFHWDLPLALQKEGGWTNRDTADHFVRYAEVVTKRFGTRVKNWMTHNEPWVVSFVGHLYGAHAPGLRDLLTALRTAHGIMLSHGKAVPVIRAYSPGARVGIVHNLEWVNPASDREEDRAAAARHDGAFNRWFLDPVFRGTYPEDMLAWYGKNAPEVRKGDLEAMSVKTDFLGINYYTRRNIAHDPSGDFLQVRRVRYPFVPHAEFEEWENNPEGLYRTLMRVHADYGKPVMYVTENGTPLQDVPTEDGLVHDQTRVEYLKRHAAAIWQAIRDGADLRGYFIWSFMDNFEWAFGFTKRFGLVHVDYRTQERTLKDSALWLGRVLEKGGFNLS